MVISEEFDTLFHLVFYLCKRIFKPCLADNIMRCGENSNVRKATFHFTRHNIYLGYSVYLITEKFYPYRLVRCTSGRENLKHIASYPELVTDKIHIVAFILYFYKLFYYIVTASLLSLADRKHILAVILGTAKAVDTAYTRYDNYISALRKRGCCRVSQAVYLIVYCTVLFDIGIG